MVRIPFIEGATPTEPPRSGPERMLRAELAELDKLAGKMLVDAVAECAAIDEHAGRVLVRELSCDLTGDVATMFAKRESYGAVRRRAALVTRYRAIQAMRAVEDTLRELARDWSPAAVELYQKYIARWRAEL